jgi:two-component system cell cycle sensor histidine kinase/response regulator CckA
VPSSADCSQVGLSVPESTPIPVCGHEYARLATVVEQASDAILITDMEGTIQYVNPAFERISGYTRGEVIGQSPRILKSGKNEPALYENLWDTILRGAVWKGHLVNRRKDGSLYQVEATVSPVRDRDGRIVNYAAVTRDVTQEIELETRLRQAEKMEAVGQLASGVAHDFNNVLTAILGSAGLLRSKLCEQPVADDAVVKGLEQIEHLARRGASLTRQLLTFNRREVVKLELLNLNQIVADSERMLRRLIVETITLKLDLAPDVRAIRADAGQVEQILMNLVVNARDAMPEGGRLTIATANVHLDEAHVSSHADACIGPHVLLTVRDTGCGMTAEVLKHMYEPFFTTKPPGKGTGLGLATVYTIVRRLDGHITVSTAANEGTEFRVYFPALLGRVHETPAGVADMLPSGTETVLVCEDDAVIRELECEILEHSGYTVLAAEHGERAIELAADTAGQIDLLITDVVMPETSGPAVASQLTAQRPGLKVLFVSGYSDDAAARLGAQDDRGWFLHKPFTLREFLERVRQVLDEERSACQDADGRVPEPGCPPSLSAPP